MISGKDLLILVTQIRKNQHRFFSRHIQLESTVGTSGSARAGTFHSNANPRKRFTFIINHFAFNLLIGRHVFDYS
ncbi:hypothetical protein SDC9_123521 [bioreactor metagenome]|uniref:Uncharacterized protein n=1 Tax=bioreactor metagenome TaxID=1076179 RepID=A0A645CHV2_9ZZZZ